MARNSEPQGCLAFILNLFGIKVGTRDAPAKSLPYRLRDDFLSRAEYSFYRVLVQAVGSHAVVCPKVNLADIFFVARPNENQSYRNKIDRKHVDFLLCDPTTMKPLVGVELDDSSHKRRDRVARDQFVDTVSAAAGLALVHIPAKSGYDLNALAAHLAPHLGQPSTAAPRPTPTPRPAAAPPATAAPPRRTENPSPTPVCPKCDIPMVQRGATKGPNKGNPFWGCSNYPQCRDRA